MEISTTKERIYHKGSHTVHSCIYHVIWCPKYRRPVLVGEVETRLKELIMEQALNVSAKVVELEVMPDHVHLLIDIDPTIGIHKTISKIKGYTSNKLRGEFPDIKSKLPTMWSRSKFIATVGSVSLEVVKRYIEDQKGK